MSDIEHCLPTDHPVSRDVPTLIYNSAAWVKAEHYDNAKIEIQRLAGAVDLIAQAHEAVTYTLRCPGHPWHDSDEARKWLMDADRLGGQ